MKESSMYQAILKEGRAEGIAKGMAKGMAQGRTEGAVLALRKVLRAQGEGCFGPIDVGTAAAIERIDDLGQLEELCAKLPGFGRWHELLANVNPNPRGRRRRPPT